MIYFYSYQRNLFTYPHGHTEGPLVQETALGFAFSSLQHSGAGPPGACSRVPAPAVLAAHQQTAGLV